MPDIGDKGAAAADLFLDVALRNRRHGATIAPTGKCLCCEAPLPSDRRWCDAECRDLWEAERKRG